MKEKRKTLVKSLFVLSVVSSSILNTGCSKSDDDNDLLTNKTITIDDAKIIIDPAIQNLYSKTNFEEGDKLGCLLYANSESNNKYEKANVTLTDGEWKFSRNLQTGNASKSYSLIMIYPSTIMDTINNTDQMKKIYLNADDQVLYTNKQITKNSNNISSMNAVMGSLNIHVNTSQQRSSSSNSLSVKVKTQCLFNAFDGTTTSVGDTKYVNMNVMNDNASFICSMVPQEISTLEFIYNGTEMNSPLNCKIESGKNAYYELNISMPNQITFRPISFEEWQKYENDYENDVII